MRNKDMKWVFKKIEKNTRRRGGNHLDSAADGDRCEPPIRTFGWLGFFFFLSLWVKKFILMEGLN